KGQSERSETSLIDRIRTAIARPEAENRFGSLSLGESTHMVDEISLLRETVQRGRLLIAEEDGDLSLPIWPDHVGSVTRWGQYRLSNHRGIDDAELKRHAVWPVI